MASNYKVVFEENNDIYTKAINKQKREAIEGDKLPTFIDDNTKSKTLVFKPLVRLDLQGQFKDKNGIPYSNLKIQLNKQTLLLDFPPPNLSVILTNCKKYVYVIWM